MSIAEIRTWLITVSLSVLAAEFAFFLLAPLEIVGYPIDFSESMRILEILTPVFLGYLGAATRFVFNPAPNVVVADAADVSQQLKLLVRGPVLIWVLGTIAAIVSFGLGNRFGASGSGPRMTIDQFAGVITGLLSLLTVTTTVIVSNVFGVAPAPPGKGGAG